MVRDGGSSAARPPPGEDDPHDLLLPDISDGHGGAAHLPCYSHLVRSYLGQAPAQLLNVLILVNNVASAGEHSR